MSQNKFYQLMGQGADMPSLNSKTFLKYTEVKFQL